MGDIDIAKARWILPVFSFDTDPKAMLGPALDLIGKLHDLYICPTDLEDYPEDRTGYFNDIYVIPRQDISGFVKSNTHMEKGDFQSIGAFVNTLQPRGLFQTRDYEIIVRLDNPIFYDFYVK